jgi:hypothetical protein
MRTERSVTPSFIHRSASWLPEGAQEHYDRTMQGPGDEQSGRASSRLDQLRRDGETITGRAMPQAPVDSDDPAELWGRRIGRALGWLAAAFLLYQLYLAYVA